MQDEDGSVIRINGFLDDIMWQEYDPFHRVVDRGQLRDVYRGPPDIRFSMNGRVVDTSTTVDSYFDPDELPLEPQRLQESDIKNLPLDS
jgi:hypothetical protein